MTGKALRALLGRNCYICANENLVSRRGVPPCFHPLQRLDAFSRNLAYSLMIMNTPDGDYYLWSQLDWPWNTYKDRLWTRQQYALWGYIKDGRPT